MSGYDPEDPMVDDLDAAPPAEEPWVEDEPTPASDLAHVGAVVEDLVADLHAAPPDAPPVPDAPPPDTVPSEIDGTPPEIELSGGSPAISPSLDEAAPPEVDLSIELPPEPPEPPPLYEEGTLVSQVPPSDDLATVDMVTTSEVYEAWVAGGDTGGPGAAVGGFEPGSPWDRPGMVGDAGDVNFWFQQNSQFSCGPSSAAQIISDFTGNIQADESLLAARALEQGWYDPASGMTADNLERLLDDQGVPSTVHRDQGFADVEQYLREGRAVVMFLDARDVMPTTGFEDYVAADQPENSAEDTVDHFVRVIGIDRAANVAILANPGYAGASQVEIPLDQLEEAWNDNTNRPGFAVDRAHILIVSDAADTTPDDAGLGQPQPQPQPGPQPEPQPQPQPQPDPGGQPTPVPQPTPDGQPTPQPVPDGQPTPQPQPQPEPTGQPSDPVRPAAPGTQTPASPGGPSGEPAPSAPDRSDPVPARERVAAAATPTVLNRPAPLPGDIELPDAVAPAPVAAPAPSDDGGLFGVSAGWVLIPVTFAAGRVSAALRRTR